LFFEKNPSVYLFLINLRFDYGDKLYYKIYTSLQFSKVVLGLDLNNLNVKFYSYIIEFF